MKLLQRAIMVKNTYCLMLLISPATALAAPIVAPLAGTAANPVAPAPTSTPAPSVTPAPNAYDLYLAAGNTLDSAALAAGTSTPDTSSPTDAALLKANARALALLRQGFRHTFQNPPSAATDMSYIAKMRALAHLLVLDERAHAQLGDWRGATRCSLECYRFGIDLPHGGDIIDLNIGIECEALGREGIYRALPHLGPLDSVALARHLSRLQAQFVPYSDLLRAEQREGMRLLLDLFKEPNWQKAEKTRLSADQLTSAYMNATELAVLNAHRPYAAHKTGNRQPTDPVLQLVLTPYAAEDLPELGNDSYRFLYELDCARNSILTTQAALQAFHAVQHYYPQSLNELAPLFFAAPPPDPFAINASLQYRQVANSYLLYSLGPDCTDNHGRPIEDPTAKLPAQRYRIYPTSQGDIVAGVDTK